MLEVDLLQFKPPLARTHLLERYLGGLPCASRSLPCRTAWRDLCVLRGKVFYWQPGFPGDSKPRESLELIKAVQEPQPGGTAAAVSQG